MRLWLLERIRETTFTCHHILLVVSLFEQCPHSKILILGGYANGLETGDIYVLASGASSWKKLKLAMPYVTAYHGTMFLHGELYVFGGCTNNTYKLNHKKKWKKMADMNEKRSGITNSCVEFDSSIWVMGGNDIMSPLNSVERYDSIANKWSYMP